MSLFRAPLFHIAMPFYFFAIFIGFLMSQMPENIRPEKNLLHKVYFYTNFLRVNQKTDKNVTFFSNESLCANFA